MGVIIGNNTYITWLCAVLITLLENGVKQYTNDIKTYLQPTPTYSCRSYILRSLISLIRVSWIRFLLLSVHARVKYVYSLLTFLPYYICSIQSTPFVVRSELGEVVKRLRGGREEGPLFPPAIISWFCQLEKCKGQQAKQISILYFSNLSPQRTILQTNTVARRASGCSPLNYAPRQTLILSVSYPHSRF